MTSFFYNSEVTSCILLYFIAQDKGVEDRDPKQPSGIM
jgi:hypothetical protein